MPSNCIQKITNANQISFSDQSPKQPSILDSRVTQNLHPSQVDLQLKSLAFPRSDPKGRRGVLAPLKEFH